MRQWAAYGATGSTYAIVDCNTEDAAVERLRALLGEKMDVLDYKSDHDADQDEWDGMVENCVNHRTASMWALPQFVYDQMMLALAADAGA